MALTAADFNFEKETVRINKFYQRLHGEDVITTPKTKKSNRMIKMPKFLCVKKCREYLQMLLRIEEERPNLYGHKEYRRGVYLNLLTSGKVE